MNGRGGSSSIGSSSSSDYIGKKVATSGVVRRWEDVVSDEDEEGGGVEQQQQHYEPEKTRGKTPRSKQARHLPAQKPRSTDFFVFDVVEKSDPPPSSLNARSNRIAGSKGKPSTVHSNAHLTSTQTLAERDYNTRQVSAATGRKSSSGIAKATRRVSLLTDGTPAYPHPKIADDQLYKHCSGDDSQDRMKHVAGWTLERSRQGVEKSAYRESLMAAFKKTLEDLNEGLLHIDWQQERKGKQKNNRRQYGGNDSSSASMLSSSSGKKEGKKASHPRNEANLKAEVDLVEKIKRMQKEEKAWKEAKMELKVFEAETQKLKEDLLALSDEGDTTSTDGEAEWDEEAERRLALARKALSREQDWAKSSSDDWTEPHEASDIDADVQDKRRSQLGTPLDPRWRDVEFKADLLHLKAHSFAQLSALSQRYITAVSARGAKALLDMTKGSSAEHQHSRRSEHSSGSSSNSITTHNGSGGHVQADLERILYSLRAIEDERGYQDGENDGDDDDTHLQQRGHRGVGDTSEGEILRALAKF
ncbi:hypothetical protein CBS101457_004223 [Exobasidium rhododendri]|nr:hypothetical protein CBS101457_004223 [Exobasidium rhododendri]